MERIEGFTVKERWPVLSTPQKLAVVEQLNLMVSSMRLLKQAPGNTYIGQSLCYDTGPNFAIDPDLGALHHGYIHEQVWNNTYCLGPFDSVKVFTD